MICPSCGTDSQGTETSPGTVSSTCPPCNIKLTGRGHCDDAYDVDATGELIAQPMPAAKPPIKPMLDARAPRRVKSRQPV